MVAGTRAAFAPVSALRRAAVTLTLALALALTLALTLTLTCARGGGEERGGNLRDLDVGDRLAVAREGGGALLGGGGDRVAQPREPLGRELVERAWLGAGWGLG